MDELKSWLSRLPAPTDLGVLIDTRLIRRTTNLDLKLRPHASAHAPALLSTDSATGRPTLIGGVSILSFNRAISLSSPLPSADGRLITVHLNYLREQIRLIAIYAPTQFYRRRIWWTTTLIPALEAPTAASASMLVGDFNSVILPIDRNRPPEDFEAREGASFAKLMDNHALVDTFRALHRTRTDVFSFFGRQRHNIATPPTSSRLDRMYISRAFLPRLTASPYIQTNTLLSDHLYAPLCSLSFINPTVAPRPWRLRQHLLMRPHVAQIIDSALTVFPSSPSPDSWDSWKLDLTLNLKRFSNQERRRVDGTTAHLELIIGSLQRQAAYTPLNRAESDRLDQARLHLARYEASKASEIALKAKLKVEGHREMGVSSLLSGLNSRIKGSIISSLTLPNGQTTSDLSTMTSMCSSFFQSLYSGSNPATPNSSFWQHIPPSSIPNPLLLRLSAPFSLAEIGKALLSLSRGKTPGPDGLPGELFRHFAPRFAPAFHSLLSPPQPLSRLPPSMLTGRTVLIPKRGDSSLVENLRPITLMNADYKVLALCLANRLQLALPQLIHPSQTAFIKHRIIGDTINDTLDIMDWAAYSSAPLLALTVDFRKAYDLVDRPFLLQALAVLGLPAPFIHWVRLMHSDTSTRISVNNMLGPTFPVRTGVRQGCPLALLLFVCVIEIFHRYMSLFLPGFALSPAQRRLMACYADDVTPFLTSDSELGLVVMLLGVFGSVSGEVVDFIPPSSVSATVHPVSPNHRIGRTPINTGLFRLHDLIEPSRQRDILFRLYTPTLPSGSRFQYFDDRGICPRCPAAVVETLPHIFFECASAGNVISALRTVADRHLGQTPPAEHIFFPIQSRVGQSPPWSLLVGAAVKTLWNSRCDHRHRNSSSSSFEILQLILAQKHGRASWRCRPESATPTAPPLQPAKSHHHPPPITSPTRRNAAVGAGGETGGVRNGRRRGQKGAAIGAATSAVVGATGGEGEGETKLPPPYLISRPPRIPPRPDAAPLPLSRLFMRLGGAESAAAITASAKELEPYAMRTSGSGADGGNPQMKLRRLLVSKCRGNQTVCRSRCVDTSTDVNNCGACGNFCEVSQNCCGGSCVDLLHSNDHCGACGASCPGICTSGMCFNFD
ncbi:unnamed protein product [Closterium sp. Naga37s-1]|nr:unnamed protein product [Closterium sp. Naga37s-1]